MSLTRKTIPDEGDLVLCTVKHITNHGAYVNLDEYDGVKGFIHISEIASRWIKNIRNFVREDQKVVAKVLRSNKAKRQIDLSIRRVTEQQKKNKIQEWKRAKNSEELLKLAAEKIGETLEKAYKDVGWKLEDKFGEIYFGLQQVKEKGESALVEAGIPEKWRKVILDIANAYVELPTVKLTANLEVTCYQPDGVEAIKKALLKGLKMLSEFEDVKGRIYLVGSPRYSLELEAPDYKIGEKVLKKTAEAIIEEITKMGGKGSWKRGGFNKKRC
ncbi:MAG: translation initiation factor IF-2 subunit alpha [Candidatus Odinarchaeia archaeon]